MDICNVLKQVKELTGSAKTALPEIYSEELSEDDWWHKAMGVTFTLALSDLTAAREGL